MNLLTDDLRAQLRANDHAHCAAQRRRERSPDPLPVVRLFNPVGHGTWLATELDEEGVLFGLADLGFGCPELGSFSLQELEALRLPFGMTIERDLHFYPTHRLSVYAEAARVPARSRPPSGSFWLPTGSCAAGDRPFRCHPSMPSPERLPHGCRVSGGGFCRSGLAGLVGVVVARTILRIDQGLKLADRGLIDEAYGFTA
jgi:hypothetical protein